MQRRKVGRSTNTKRTYTIKRAYLKGTQRLVVGAMLSSDTIGKAIAYSLKRWDKLSLYTVDGRLQIDNNLVENQIRAVALGCKNYLFAGSHQAAKYAAYIIVS